MLISSPLFTIILVYYRLFSWWNAGFLCQHFCHANMISAPSFINCQPPSCVTALHFLQLTGMQQHTHSYIYAFCTCWLSNGSPIIDIIRDYLYPWSIGGKPFSLYTRTRAYLSYSLVDFRRLACTYTPHGIILTCVAVNDDAHHIPNTSPFQGGSNSTTVIASKLTNNTTNDQKFPCTCINITADIESGIGGSTPWTFTPSTEPSNTSTTPLVRTDKWSWVWMGILPQLPTFKVQFHYV